VNIVKDDLAAMNQDFDASVAQPLFSAAIRSAQDSGAEEIVELFSTLRAPLLRYLLAFGISVHDGEEIVQEAFLGLFQHLARGKPRDNLHGWMFRVCHNLALKHRDKARGMQNVLSGPPGWIAGHADLAPNPEEQLVHAQRGEKLQAVLNALPEQDRCCLSLRAEGLRYREIAGILGMSLGAVSISLARSLARFKRAGQE
jgi:RNA polymerase sigma-70 factor (ECF subfamily)